MVSWTRKMWRTVSVASTCRPIVPRKGTSLGAAISAGTGCIVLAVCASAAGLASAISARRSETLFTNSPPEKNSMEKQRTIEGQQSTADQHRNPGAQRRAGDQFGAKRRIAPGGHLVHFSE